MMAAMVNALALIRFGVARGGSFVVMLFGLGIVGALAWALARPDKSEPAKR
jgi:hypothetical protein